MDDQFVHNYDSYSMFIMNEQSKIRRLYTPFSVLCTETIDEVNIGSTLCVDEIFDDEDDILLYKINGNLYSYKYFIILEY